jgi:hypothetical protein
MGLCETVILISVQCLATARNRLCYSTFKTGLTEISFEDAPALDRCQQDTALDVIISRDVNVWQGDT